MANDHGEVLRTGVLFKKGSGTGPFGRRNWKPRYFVLSPSKLQYYTYEDGDLKGELDLTGCNEQSLAVMPADSMKTGSSASTIWRIAITTADRRMLVAAGTELEMNDWVEQFLAAFRINSGKPAAPQRHSLPSNHNAGVMQPMGGAGVTTSRNSAPSANGPDSGNSNNTITDFQNFAGARRSVGHSMRSSVGVHGGHEFRLSEEVARHQQELEQQRVAAEMEAERAREQELLQVHLRQQEATLQEQQQQHQRRSSEERMQAHESLLESQRQIKREKHERERLQREKELREQEELLAQEKQHEDELQAHFETSEMEVEIHRPMVVAPTSPPRSSLIHDVKKDMMLRQQAEHQRRRETTIQEQQNQMRMDYLAQQKAEQDRLRSEHVTAKKATPPCTPPRSPRTPPRASMGTPSKNMASSPVTPSPTSPGTPPGVPPAKTQQSIEYQPMTSYEF